MKRVTAVLDLNPTPSSVYGITGLRFPENKLRCKKDFSEMGGGGGLVYRRINVFSSYDEKLRRKNTVYLFIYISRLFWSVDVLVSCQTRTPLIFGEHLGL